MHGELNVILTRKREKGHSLSTTVQRIPRVSEEMFPEDVEQITLDLS